MRTHVEVDPIVGLTGMEAVLPLREEYAPALDLQVCAFAQEGILQAPGTVRALLSAITIHPAAMLRLRDYGLVPGCWADLVVWECERPEEVAAALPGRALVVKRGRVTVQSERRVIERWRAR